MNLSVLFRDFHPRQNNSSAPLPLIRPSYCHNIYIISESLPPFAIPCFPKSPTHIQPPPLSLLSWYIYLSPTPSSCRIVCNCARLYSLGRYACTCRRTPPQTSISTVPRLCCNCRLRPVSPPPPFKSSNLSVYVVPILSNILQCVRPPSFLLLTFFDYPRYPASHLSPLPSSWFSTEVIITLLSIVPCPSLPLYFLNYESD